MKINAFQSYPIQTKTNANKFANKKKRNPIQISKMPKINKIDEITLVKRTKQKGIPLPISRYLVLR